MIKVILILSFIFSLLAALEISYRRISFGWLGFSLFILAMVIK